MGDEVAGRAGREDAVARPPAPAIDPLLDAFGDRARDLGASEVEIEAGRELLRDVAEDREAWQRPVERSLSGVSPALATAMRRGADLAARYLAEIDHADADLLRSIASSIAQPAPSGRARWSRAPGDPLPAPASPCPCGSGRRFKKCCKPR